MKKNEFFKKLVDDLELENSNIDENFSVYLTSLNILSLIVLIDENFNKQLKASEFSGIKTIKDIMQRIGMENFS
jgi:acyl carrier protein